MAVFAEEKEVEPDKAERYGSMERFGGKFPMMGRMMERNGEFNPEDCPMGLNREEILQRMKERFGEDWTGECPFGEENQCQMGRRGPRMKMRFFLDENGEVPEEIREKIQEFKSQFGKETLKLQKFTNSL